MEGEVIRMIFSSKLLAEKITEEFFHLNLKITEMEVIGEYHAAR